MVSPEFTVQRSAVRGRGGEDFTDVTERVETPPIPFAEIRECAEAVQSEFPETAELFQQASVVLGWLLLEGEAS